MPRPENIEWEDQGQAPRQDIHRTPGRKVVKDSLTTAADDIHRTPGGQEPTGWNALPVTQARLRPEDVVWNDDQHRQDRQAPEPGNITWEDEPPQHDQEHPSLVQAEDPSFIDRARDFFLGPDSFFTPGSSEDEAARAAVELTARQRGEHLDEFRDRAVHGEPAGLSLLDEYTGGMGMAARQVAQGYHGSRAMMTEDAGQRAYHMDKYRDLQERTREEMVSVPEFTEIRSADDAVRWGAKSAGALLPILGSIYAGAKVGGATGGTAGSLAGPKGRAIGTLAGSTTGSFMTAYSLYAGGMYGDLTQRGAEHEDARRGALQYGAPAAGVSIIVPMGLYASVMGYLGKDFVKNRMKNYLTTVPLATVAEGGAETLAESFVMAGEEDVLGIEIPEDERKARLINAGAEGSFMGGTIGTIGGMTRPAGDIDTAIDTFLDDVEASYQQGDRDVIRQTAIEHLEAADSLTQDQEAMLAYLKTEQASHNRPLNRELREMEEVSREVFQRDPQDNISRARQLQEKMEAGNLSGREALELTSILSNQRTIEKKSPPRTPEQRQTDAMRESISRGETVNLIQPQRSTTQDPGAHLMDLVHTQYQDPAAGQDFAFEGPGQQFTFEAEPRPGVDFPIDMQPWQRIPEGQDQPLLGLGMGVDHHLVPDAQRRDLPVPRGQGVRRGGRFEFQPDIGPVPAGPAPQTVRPQPVLPPEVPAHLATPGRRPAAPPQDQAAMPGPETRAPAQPPADPGPPAPPPAIGPAPDAPAPQPVQPGPGPAAPAAPAAAAATPPALDTAQVQDTPQTEQQPPQPIQEMTWSQLSRAAEDLGIPLRDGRSRKSRRQLEEEVQAAGQEEQGNADWQRSRLRRNPHVSDGTVVAKREKHDGQYTTVLRWKEDQQEVFPGRRFESASEARDVFRAQRSRAKANSERFQLPYTDDEITMMQTQEELHAREPGTEPAAAEEPGRALPDTAKAELEAETLERRAAEITGIPEGETGDLAAYGDYARRIDEAALEQEEINRVAVEYQSYLQQEVEKAAAIDQQQAEIEDIQYADDMAKIDYVRSNLMGKVDQQEVRSYAGDAFLSNLVKKFGKGVFGRRGETLGLDVIAQDMAQDEAFAYLVGHDSQHQLDNLMQLLENIPNKQEVREEYQQKTGYNSPGERRQAMQRRVHPDPDPSQPLPEGHPAADPDAAADIRTRADEPQATPEEAWRIGEQDPDDTAFIQAHPAQEPVSLDAGVITRQVNEIVRQVMPALDGHVHVVQSEAELPVSLRNAIARQAMEGQFEAVQYNGEIYIVADSLSSERVGSLAALEASVRHEGRHKFFTQVLGGVQQKRQFMSRAARKMNNEVRQWLESYDLENTTENRRMAAEEILADMARTGRTGEMLDQLIARIAEWIRSIAPNLNLTNAEIRRLLATADQSMADAPAQDAFITTQEAPQYLFAGAGAATARSEPLRQAQAMKRQGQSREDIWQETGWWEIVPDQWAFEIDDSMVSFKDKLEVPTEGRLLEFDYLKNMVDAKKLFDAYPRLREIDVRVAINPSIEEASGEYTPFEDRASEGLFDVEETISIDAPNIEKARSVLLHEIQHAVQEYEGFAKGGSPAEFVRSQKSAWRQIDEINHQLSDISRHKNAIAEDFSIPGEEKVRQIAELNKAYEELINRKINIVEVVQQDPMRQYRSLTGEVEARLVQRRMDMTPEQRQAEPPWQTLENVLREEGLLTEGQTPEDVLISRHDTGEQAMAADTAEQDADVDPATDDIRFQRHEPPPRETRNTDTMGQPAENVQKGPAPVEIPGDSYDGAIKNNVKTLFSSATDRLRGIGRPWANDLADSIDNYYNKMEQRMGEVNGPLRPVLKRASKADKKAFEAFWRHKENGRTQEARQVYENASQPARDLIQTWRRLADHTGQVNQEIRTPDGKPMQVYDPGVVKRHGRVLGTIERAPDGTETVVRRNEDGSREVVGTFKHGRSGRRAGLQLAKRDRRGRTRYTGLDIGGWRPIGRVRDFFPRTFRPEVSRVLQNPDVNPALWNQLVDALLQEGYIQNREEAADYLASHMTGEVRNDYFSGVERARKEPLPEIFYDYSFDAISRYLGKWSKRTAQIEHFGQDIGQGEMFAEIKPKIRDGRTVRYVEQIEQRVYEAHGQDTMTNVMQHLNLIATGLQLGNPATATLNLIGGTVLNMQHFGTRRTLQAWKELIQSWEDVQQAGTSLGILGKDVVNLLNDSALQSEGYVTNAERFKPFLADITSWMMKYGGYKPTENLIRSTAMLAARANLMDFLKAYNQNPGSRKSGKFMHWARRNDLDYQKLVLENGRGPETAKLLRKSVNIPQGSYRIDMTPVYVDTVPGRFFLKYHKFMTQVNRMFWMNHLKPFVDSVTRPDQKQYRAERALELFKFFAVGAVGGTLIAQARQELFNYQDPGPELEDLAQILEDDDRARGLAWVFSRVWNSLLSSGVLGYFGNYIQMGRDVMDQQRVKSPLEPPGMALIEGMTDAVLTAIGQEGDLRARDFDRMIENNWSAYRAYKRMGLRALEEAGSQWNEVRLNSAQRDVRYARKITRQYLDDMDIEHRRAMFRGRFMPTPMTPVNREINESLMVGDAQRARLIYQEAMQAAEGAEERRRVRASVQASVRNRQPITFQGRPNEQERRAFLRWAEENAAPANYERISRLDRQYRQAAQQAGLMSSGH